MKNFITTSLIFLTAILTGCQDKNQTTMIVATFNLRLAPTPQSNTWQTRAPKVAKIILDNKFDIFGTQEGFLHQLEDIKRATSMEYIGRAREDGKQKGEYAAIFYNKEKFELLDNGDFWFAENPSIPQKGWDAACKRVCTWGKFRDKLNGNKFYFISLHFDHRGKLARLNSAKLLTQKVREIAKDAPFFCVGDFNATPKSDVIKIIFAVNLFKDSYNASKTLPQGKGTFHNFTGIPKNDRIDYIFTSPNVDILEYRVIETYFEENGTKTYPSDHFPVAIKAKVQDAQ